VLWILNYKAAVWSVADVFTEDNIRTTAFYGQRQQRQQLMQMSTDVIRRCRLRRCGIAMVIVIFAGQFSLK